MSLKYLKKGFKNIATYGISSAISRSISLILFPYYLNNITLEQLGIWDYYQSWFSLGSLLLGSSATIGFVRFYLLYQNDIEKQCKAASNSLILGMINCIILTVAFLIVYNSPLKKYCYNKYLLTTMSTIIFFTFFSLALTYIRTKEYLLSYILFSGFQSISASIFIVLGIYYNYGIDAFFWGTFFSFALCTFPFFYLLYHYHDFSLEIFKEQLFYSIPLLIYSLLYASFFTIDRFILQYYAGFETLGIYAILWKFGFLFQFYALALIDASPVIFYNAQKEENSDLLLSKCIVYFIIALAIGCLLSIGGSFILIDKIIPSAYHNVKQYICSFFFALFLLECARVIQCGIGLSMKTIYAPINVAITLVIQFCFLILLHTFNIWGIIGANLMTFFIYLLLSYYTTAKLYTLSILNIRSISSIIAFFALSTFYLHCMHTKSTYIQIYNILLLIIMWLMIILKYLLDEHEKKFLRNYCSSFIFKKLYR